MVAPPDVPSLAIDWTTLVTTHAPATHPYLDAIANYSNAAEREQGVFARRFAWRSDALFNELLAAFDQFPIVAPKLVAQLLARTALAGSLTSFHASPETLAAALAGVPVEPIAAFDVVGQLASTLYDYGMYRFFRDDHTRGEAQALARSFVNDEIGDDLDSQLVLRIIHPWGRWFDPHSCSDLTVLLLDRKGRRGVVMAFSHSD